MKTIGRSDPCPCGSGKKYKHCCGRHEETRKTGSRPLNSSIPKAIQHALEHHQAGRLPQAEAIYRQILQEAPDYPDALHFLGVLAHQVGKNEVAVELISKAISINPYSSMYCNLGNALKDMGQFDAAVECYHKALTIKPDFAEAHNNLGSALQAGGNLDMAVESYQKALSIKPNYAEAHSNLGNALKDSGKFDAAVECYHKALSIRPDFAEAFSNLGVVLQAQNKLDAAIMCLRRALAIRPDYFEAHNNLGNALQAQGKLNEAIECCHKALSIKPEYLEAHYNLANMLQAQGKLDEAIESYRRALLIKPDFAEAIDNLGNALKAQGKLDEAIENYHKALAINPDHFGTYNNLGKALQAQGKLDAAIKSYQLAQSLQPKHFEWTLVQLAALPLLTDSRTHISRLRTSLADDAERLVAQDGLVHRLEIAQFSLFSLAYHGTADRTLMEKVSRLVRSKAPVLTRSLVQPQRQKSNDNRIRVGFLSSFLYCHTMGKLTQGYIRHLDRSRFHVTVIHAPGSKIDDIRNAIDSMADASVILTNHIEPAQQQVADLNLDILHYPDIGMSSFTYFLAYARLAPVQTVSWGHPVTTGLESIDYFLSFDAAEPQEAEEHYTETLVRLNRPPTYYEPFFVPTEIASKASMGLPVNGKLYGCLQSLFKFHPDFDESLADIIARDPQGWIIAIEDKGAYLRDQLRQRWARSHPTLLERVFFLPALPQDSFMKILAQMDVLLDTPHFGSGNTLYESLAYGIPTITWPGEFMRGRLVDGMYKWLEINDAPVAATQDAYAQLAVEFATDRARREAFRQQLVEKAPLVYRDVRAVREMEQFLECAVVASRRGEKLSHWPKDK